MLTGGLIARWVVGSSLDDGSAGFVPQPVGVQAVRVEAVGGDASGSSGKQATVYAIETLGCEKCEFAAIL